MREGSLMVWGAVAQFSPQVSAFVATPGIRRIDHLVYVGGLVAELNAHPELWNEFDLRTNHPQSPHRELSDIFVRYNARANFTGDRHAFNEPHDAVWWPSIEKLPSVKPIVFDLMRHVEGERLGMVLITKIPAGATCYPHKDNGWHARHYDKYAVQLASAPGQVFHVDGVSLSAEPGECYWFNNSRPHSVTNESDEDRLTMIVCIRNRFTGAGA
jgi:hypothetical protein